MTANVLKDMLVHTTAIGTITYKIDNFLGKGVNGKVYKVTQTQTQKQYAAKISNNRNFFTKEVKNFEKIKFSGCSQYIVSLYDVFMDARTQEYVLILELMSGDLHTYIYSGIIPTSKKFQIAYSLIKGLECFSVKGFAHRDIKLENILYKDNPWSVKYSDLEMLYHISDPECFCVGSKEYLSPEAAKKVLEIKAGIAVGDVKFADALTQEVWALGIVFWELLSQGYPFHDVAEQSNEEIALTLLKNIRTVPEPKIQKQTDIRNAFDAEFLKCVVMEMLHIDPKKRLMPDEIVKGFDIYMTPTLRIKLNVLYEKKLVRAFKKVVKEHPDIYAAVKQKTGNKYHRIGFGELCLAIENVSQFTEKEVVEGFIEKMRKLNVIEQGGFKKPYKEECEKLRGALKKAKGITNKSVILTQNLFFVLYTYVSAKDIGHKNIRRDLEPIRLLIKHYKKFINKNVWDANLQQINNLCESKIVSKDNEEICTRMNEIVKFLKKWFVE